jgi:hypothetical protein
MSTYVIRHASREDEPALQRLADLNAQPPVGRPALVGEVDTRVVAAVSLTDCRLISDPNDANPHQTRKLLARGRMIHAMHTSPSLRELLVATLRA